MDIEQLTRALEDWVMQAVTQGQEILAIRLRKFNEGLEATVDGRASLRTHWTRGAERLRNLLARYR